MSEDHKVLDGETVALVREAVDLCQRLQMTLNKLETSGVTCNFEVTESERYHGIVSSTSTGLATLYGLRMRPAARIAV